LSRSKPNPQNPPLTPSPLPPTLRYKDWCLKTPYITRSYLQILSLSYLLSYLLPLPLFLSNIPLFTIQNLELYRIATTAFVCDSVFTLIFSGLTLTGVGGRLERR